MQRVGGLERRLRGGERTQGAVAGGDRQGCGALRCVAVRCAALLCAALRACLARCGALRCFACMPRPLCALRCFALLCVHASPAAALCGARAQRAPPGRARGAATKRGRPRRRSARRAPAAPRASSRSSAGRAAPTPRTRPAAASSRAADATRGRRRRAARAMGGTEGVGVGGGGWGGGTYAVWHVRGSGVARRGVACMWTWCGTYVRCGTYVMRHACSVCGVVWCREPWRGVYGGVVVLGSDGRSDVAVARAKARTARMAAAAEATAVDSAVRRCRWGAVACSKDGERPARSRGARAASIAAISSGWSVR